MGIIESAIKRVNQYCFKKFGAEPKMIIITNTFVEVSFWLCHDSKYIDPKELTEDLEAAYEKRKEDYYAKVKQQELEAEKRAEKKREEEKEKRKAQYLELKKEFEQD